MSFQLAVPEVPRVQGWSLPIVMSAAGVLLVIVLGLAAKFTEISWLSVQCGPQIRRSLRARRISDR